LALVTGTKGRMDVKLLAEYSVAKVLSQGQFKLKKTITYNAREGFSLSLSSTMVIKTHRLMTYNAKATVCSEIHTKHSTQSEHHVEFFYC
jgi:hypothetical protein